MVAHTSSAAEITPPAVRAPAESKSLAAERIQDRLEDVTAEPSVGAVILRWLIWGPAAAIVRLGLHRGLRPRLLHAAARRRAVCLRSADRVARPERLLVVRAEARSRRLAFLSHRPVRVGLVDMTRLKEQRR